MTPHETRRLRAIATAAKVLLDCGITTLPVSLNTIVKRLGISCMTYQEMALQKDCSVEDICREAGSMEGTASRMQGNLMVTYNDDRPEDRKRFTVAHEIGHIVLGHLNHIEGHTLKRGSCPLKHFLFFEDEANDFARNLLAPPVAQELRQNQNVLTTQVIFGMSKTAASMRCMKIGHDIEVLKRSGLYSHQKEQFTDFVRAFPEGPVKENRCLDIRKKSCGVYLDSSVKYCQHCGAPTTDFVKGRVRYLDGRTKGSAFRSFGN